MKFTAEEVFARLMFGVSADERSAFGVFHTSHRMFLVLNAHDCQISFDANIM